MRLYVLAILTLVVGCGARSEPDWSGRKVVLKYTSPLKVNDKEVHDGSAHRIYTVENVNGNRLWLVSGGVAGWAQMSEVVLYDNAIDFYTQEIRKNPSNSHAYNWRGILWRDKGEYDNAIADYNAAIQLDPKDVVAYSNRGVAWGIKKEYDKAIADFSEAIRLDPKDVGAYNNRAWLLATCPNAKFRDGKKAVELATKACELSEWKEAHSIDTLSAAFAEAGNFSKAAEMEERALEAASAESRSGFAARLALYRQKKPYRQD